MTPPHADSKLAHAQRPGRRRWDKYKTGGESALLGLLWLSIWWLLSPLLSAMFSRLLSLPLLFTATATAVGPLVDVGYSKYQGTALQNGVTQWLGIRYAAPPLGDLRFRAPQDPLANKTVQVANQHGPICLPVGQQPIQSGYSEDCLFLDVYAPSASKQSQMPVYVFFQGGGFESNANPNYNGSGLITASDHNAVIVTLGYRVGPFGFLSSSDIVQNGDTNAGIKDQRAALQWVQKYISKFGGNPQAVTIGGASAGGQSVFMQLTAYGGRNDNLFIAAAAEAQSFPAMNTVSSATYLYKALVNSTGCDDATDSLQCLRSLPSSTLQQYNVHYARPGNAGIPLYEYGPVVDGGMVEDYTYRMLQDGKFIKVPSLIGDANNEGTVFTPKNTSSYAQMNAFLRSNFPKLNQTTLAKIDGLYPKAQQFPDSGPYWRTVSNAYGEMRYICPGEFASSVMAAAGVAVFNWRYAVQDPTNYQEGYGTTHTEELNAIWGPTYVSGTPPASYLTTNRNIVPVMQGYWTSFIRSQNPNSHRAQGSPSWDSWSPQKQDRIMMITNGTKMETVPADQASRCQYLSSIAIAIDQ